MLPRCRDRVSLNQIANECTFDLITVVLKMGYCLSKVQSMASLSDRLACRNCQPFPSCKPLPNR